MYRVSTQKGVTLDYLYIKPPIRTVPEYKTALESIGADTSRISLTQLTISYLESHDMTSATAPRTRLTVHSTSAEGLNELGGALDTALNTLPPNKQ